MATGDILIGLAASGPHSNGYSLIRKVVERSGLGWDAPCPFNPGKTLAEALLTPTRIYVKSVLPLVRSGSIKGLAHITGGGLTDNTPRMLPDRLKPVYNMKAWPRPAVFQWLQDIGQITETELQRAFNCGIGMVLAVSPADVNSVQEALKASGETSWVIGTLEDT